MPFLTRITRYRPDDDGSFTPFARAFYALLPMVVNELDKGKRQREREERRERVEGYSREGGGVRAERKWRRERQGERVI